MPSCPNVHEHDVFQIPSREKQYDKLITKLKRFLRSDAGHTIGERKKGNLSSFRGFPRGHLNERCIFIYCRDCKKEIIVPNCTVCESSEHSMDDAVLIMIGNHKEVYGETGERIIGQLRWAVKDSSKE